MTYVLARTMSVRVGEGWVMAGMGPGGAARGAEGDRRSIIIARDYGIDERGVLAALRHAPIGAGARIEPLLVDELSTRAGLGEADLILVVIDRAPDSELTDRLAHLTRGVAVALIVPAERLDSWETIESTRSFGLVARDGLGPKVLETALRALLRARRNEVRLLKTLAAHGAALAEARFVAADLELTADALLSQLPAVTAAETEGVAREAIEALAEAGARIGAALAGAGADRPADLARLVENRVRPEGQEWDPHVFVLMSEDPIWLGPSEHLVGAMLDELLARWRGARGAGDRLELIVWDAGDSARISAVFSRGAGSEWNASLAWLVGDLIMRVRPLARAAGSRVEAPRFGAEDQERASFTLLVPKREKDRSSAPSPRPGVNGDLVNHHGDQLG